MKIIFMGNSEIACPILNALKKSKHQILSVVSNSPKALGRGMTYQYTPVGKLANKLDLKLISVDSLKNKQFISTIEKLQADIFVVVAFRILPSILLSLTNKGAMNLHASLLPKYRGAAPIQHAILNGDSETGISTFIIDKNLDTGPILLQKKISISNQDNFDTLSKKISDEGPVLILESLDLLEKNNYKLFSQLDKEASYAPKILKNELLIDWAQTANQINNRVRALSYSGVFTFINGKRIKLYKTRVHENNISSKPGRISIIDKKKVFISCAKDDLELIEVQMENKSRMLTSEWIKGAQIKTGDYLG
tara:strand:- start:1425 stop:2348 length:924 start_codon:yes stop_codon:yes gene_type:complete